MIEYELNGEIIYLDLEKSGDDDMHDYYFRIYSTSNRILLDSWVIYYPHLQYMVLKSIVSMNTNNKGYGSIAMKKIIELAKELNAGHIEGFISPYDINTSELKEQIYGFYKKHFAEIKESKFVIDLKKYPNIVEMLEIKSLNKKIEYLQIEKDIILDEMNKLKELSNSLLKQRKREKKITTIFKKILRDNS